MGTILHEHESIASTNILKPREEYPVTFQVGIVGSDGVLLASDRLHTESGYPRIHKGFESEKIEIIEEKKLAYCCAGDDLTVMSARRIAASIGSESIDNPKALFIQAARDAVKEEFASRSERYGGQLFGGAILLAHQSAAGVKLWKVQVEAVTPNAFAVDSPAVCIGDPCNSAVYFVERYIQKRPGRLPIDTLLPLAAHTVLMAGIMSGGIISGLEIVLCTSSGFRRLTKEELDSLTAYSADLDTDIAVALKIPL